MTGEQWRRLLRIPLKDWRHSLALLAALARGACYVLFFRLFRRDVLIKLPFFAHARVSIVGPGRVRIGAFCSVYPNMFSGLSIATQTRDSTVTIGPRASLGGLTIRCRNAVSLGEGARTAFCLIQDVAFWSSPDNGCAALDDSRPIVVGSNSWLGALSVVLGGSVVGNDSVIGWGGCCPGVRVPPATVALGNPVSRPLPIDRVLALRKS